MANLNMNGPYFFNKDKVDEVVTRTSAGNYALGYVNDENAFIVQYVGRADIDVLIGHIDQFTLGSAWRSSWINAFSLRCVIQLSRLSFFQSNVANTMR